MLLNVSRRLASLPRLNKTKALFTRTNVFQTGTFTSHSRGKGGLHSRLIVSGGIVGVISGIALWRYTTSSNQKAYGIEEAFCEEEKSDVAATEKSIAKSGDQIDDYDSRLSTAIAKSRDLLQRSKDESGAPGIVVAVGVDGKCLWSEGVGYCDVENRIPCSPLSVLRVASISKSFTMTLVAKLMEEGKLNIDKPIQEYVPEFPEKTWKGEKVIITTRQLLSHIGGIRHYSKDYMKDKSKEEKNTESSKQNDSKQKPVEPKKAGNIKNKAQNEKEIEAKKGNDTKSEKTMSDVAINEDKAFQKLTDKQRSGDERFQEFYLTGEYSDIGKAIDLFKDDPLVHKPGSKYLYTTYGWTLVSAIVEAAGGRPFLKQMADVLKELDMPYTVPDECTPLIYNRAKGYSHNKSGKLVNSPFVNLSLKWAGGGYLSTVEDLVKFGHAMLYSYQYTDRHKERNLQPGYLKPKTMATIWQPVPQTKASWDKDGKYAMGWAVVDLDQAYGQCRKGRHLVSHTGGAVGFSSVLLIVPPKEEICENNTMDKNGKDFDVPPKGVVVAIVANLGATGLYKTAVKISDIFKEL